MIEEYSLKLLCDKYGVSKENIVNKNNNILTYGEYEDIDKTLDYLINELKVSKTNIEKCPSILYRNVNAIKDNIDFLKQKDVSFSSIESCLHVLSSEPDSLKDTYDYVEENYGKESINKNTSVLICPKDLVIAVEKLGLDKTWNLVVASCIEFGFTTLEEVENIVNSIEFKKYPELFTSQTLAYGNIKEIQEMINSKEYKEHPELFTSQTLAHGSIKEIQEMINSEEFKKYPKLFTSQTLAHAKIKDIQKLLQMPYWNDIRYKDLLTSSVAAKSKQMITKLPVLFKMAEYYKIDGYLNTTFLILSPSQNFALINYLNDNNIPLIENDKLNKVFGKQPGVLKKKYGIDIKEQMLKYDFSKFSFNEDTKKGGKKNAVR